MAEESNTLSNSEADLLQTESDTEEQLEDGEAQLLETETNNEAFERFFRGELNKYTKYMLGAMAMSGAVLAVCIKCSDATPAEKADIMDIMMSLLFALSVGVLLISGVTLIYLERGCLIFVFRLYRAMFRSLQNYPDSKAERQQQFERMFESEENSGTSDVQSQGDMGIERSNVSDPLNDSEDSGLQREL